ncbi:MAG: potassium-transporting ATPase subunit KdpA, partial [Thermodesulfovibrionales bacterium]
MGILIVLTLLVRPLGGYMQSVYQGDRTMLSPVFGPLERVLYRVSGIRPDTEMNWKQYAVAMLILSFLSMVTMFAILMLQGYLPLNPQKFPGFPWDLALNTAVSFMTNTNWQAYSGESA